MRQEQLLVPAMLDRSVVFGIGLMIALLGVGAVGSYRNIESIRLKSQSVAHTHEIDRMAAELLRLVTDAVVSQQHYLLSSDSESRKACENSLRQVRIRLDELRRKMVENETQQRRLADLEREIDALRSELPPENPAPPNGGNQAELAKASVDLSLRLNTVRDKVATLRGEEGQLLLDREDLANQALQTALFSGVFLFGTGLILFTAIIELIRRNSLFRHRQQERLFAEREQLSVMLESIADAVISLDRQGRVTQWNEPAEKLTGRLRESVIGRPLSSVLRLLDEFTSAPVTIPIDEVLQKGNTTRFDVSCLAIAVDGGSLPVSGRISPIRDRSGTVDGAVLVLRQLSEERAAELARTERARILSIRADVGMIVGHAGRTEDQLEESVRVIGDQLMAVAAGLWLTNKPDGGLTLAAATTRKGWAFVPDRDPTFIGSAIHEAITERKTVTRQALADDEILQADDKTTGSAEIYVWACPFAIEDRMLGVLAVYTSKPLSVLSSSELSQVSLKLAQFIQRRSIEKARQESEELFRTLANSISQLAWMARPDGYIFWYNQRWYDYTGTTLEEMQSEGWQAVSDPAELPRIVESIKHSFATGEPWEQTFPLRRHDGEFRWHLSQMLPVRDDEGRIRLWFGTNTDVTEQRNAETRLRRVIDSMFAFVGIVAEDGTLIEVNQAPLIAAGLTRDEVIGRKFWDCHWWTHSSTVRERVQQNFEQALAGQLVRYDEEMQLQGDIRVAIDLMLQPVFDAGKLVFVIPSGVDVTARTRAEARLGASEEFLRSVLDALANHIAVLDEQGMILLVNRAWQQFADSNNLRSSNYGIGQNYLQACSPVSADCPADATIAADGIREVLEGTRPWFAMEYPCHSPTEKRWFRMRVDRFTSLNSTRVVVSHEDITARVISENATRRWSSQQERLAEIAVQLSAAEDSSATLDVVTTGARRLIESAAAETIRFLQNDDGQIQRAVSCDDEDDLRWFLPTTAAIDPIRSRVCQTNRPLRVDSLDAPKLFITVPTPPQNVVVLTSSLAAPLTDRDGRNIGLIQLRGKHVGEFTADDEAILIQLAQMASVALERSRLYDEIRDADQRKDQFLATLAHELRNPLSALTSGTQLIQMRPHDAQQVTSTASLIARQCSHLKKLVDDLLDVSRISRGKLNLQFAPTKLQEVVQQAIETAQAIIEAAEHQLTTSLAIELLHVEGDAVRLAQVVSNLLVNAAKYTPPGGRIELELGKQDGQAVIVVRDNGIGIPAEMVGRIFDLFAQVDSSHVRSQGGLGIGLTLAKTLVTMHKGQIEVASPGPNRGSTFTVRLPLIKSDDVETAGSSEATPAAAFVKRRILVVDDNQAAVHLLNRLLTILGHNVQTAEDGQTALATIAAFRPEVVISDIGMPDMSGYELARHVREMDLAALPVLVALTGYGQESDRQASFEAGFRHHLTKPVSLADLQALLETLAK